MTIEEQVAQARLELLTHGQQPHAVVMHVHELKLWLRQTSPNQPVADREDGSGWAMQELPIYRTWEMAGVSVVTEYMFRLIRQANPSILF